MRSAELYPANQQNLSSVAELDLLGEGGENGDIDRSKSFVFSVLEVTLCLIVRQLPALNPAPLASSTVQINQSSSGTELSGLIAQAMHVLEGLPDLCSPAGECGVLFRRHRYFVRTPVTESICRRCYINSADGTVLNDQCDERNGLQE